MDSSTYASLQRIGDCNDNGVRDDLDIAAGGSDTNHNGILDGCEALTDVGSSDAAPLSLSVRTRRDATFEITLLLPARQAARIEVIDVFGRRSRLLMNETLAAGRHTLSWDGRGKNGDAMAPGVYWIRLTADAGVRSKKVVLSR